MITKLLGLTAAATGAMALGLAFSTPASAALVLPGSEAGCDLYSADGCLFTYDNGDGNIFDDPQAFFDAYNAVHNPTPPPEDLPELTFLGKRESSQDFPATGDFADGLTTVTFNDLPWDVSFFAVKVSKSEVLLFGIDPSNDVTATNSRIYNKPLGEPGRNLQAISHVSFFGATDVPEPATWALMIMGFGAAGAMLRRRRAVVA